MTEDSVEVHIVWAVDFYGDIRWNHPVNRYPYNTLYFVCDGDGSVTINGKRTLLESGYVYYSLQYPVFLLLYHPYP